MKLGSLRLSGIAAAFAIAVSTAAAPAAADAASENLLSGARVVASPGVDRPDTIRDGRAVREGEAWDTTAAARFKDDTASVTFDLGAEHPIDAVWLQADHEADYEVSVSLDGEHFTRAWTSGPYRLQGMRDRMGTALDVRARYLRLSLYGGRGRNAVSELQAFEETPAPFPPSVPRVSALMLPELARNAALAMGLSWLLFLALCSRRASRRLKVALALLPATATALFVSFVPELWPFEPTTISIVRCVAAFVGGAAVLSLVPSSERFAVDRTAARCALAVSALLGLAAYANMGFPSVRDGQGRWTRLNLADAAHTFLSTRYFQELGYADLYTAEVAAYAQDTPEDMRETSHGYMRDVATSESRPAASLLEKAEALEKRFSSERWESFRRDARALRDAMGTSAWLASLSDYPGDSTPARLLLARAVLGSGPPALLANGPPDEHRLAAAAWVDPVLLLVALALVARTFGLEVALVCAALFGTNGFAAGSQLWWGAPVRTVWLACLAIGACALRKERWVLGGALLGAAACLCVSSGAALIGLLLPVALWAIDQLRAKGSLPRGGLVRPRLQGPALVFLGAALSVAVLAGLSIKVFGSAAWVAWARRLSLPQATSHPAVFGLRALIGGVGRDALRLVALKRACVSVAAVMLVAMVVLAARARRASEAVVLALLLPLASAYQATDYLYVLFLLPIAASSAGRWGTRLAPLVTSAVASAALLVAFGTEPLAAMVRTFDARVRVESAVLVAALLAFLFVLARRAREEPAVSVALGERGAEG